MSYDLIVRIPTAGRLTPEATLAAIQGVAELADLEAFVVASDAEAEQDDESDGTASDGYRDAVTVCLTADPKQAEHAFAALVGLARRLGLALDDPQDGEAVDLEHAGALPRAY